ncbi:MAG: Chromosome partitioning protein ParB [Verrucomicrobiales bacterium]|nr:Chromosome partitioning protein ParB [Verrucomicrobiales bacterium]
MIKKIEPPSGQIERLNNETTMEHTTTLSPSEVNTETEIGQVPIQYLGWSKIKPSPENDLIYTPIDPEDPEMMRLSVSIGENGLMEPLVVTSDGFILSGHRRHRAAGWTSLDKLPCRVLPFKKTDDPDRFVRLLREFNRQRDKSIDEKLREELVTTNPEESYQSLIDHRRKSSALVVQPMELRGSKKRAEISPAKQPFLDAIEKVVMDLRKFWPISERQIHYNLLNNPPLTHASKPDSFYQNNKRSSKSLSELCTRARVAGLIPMEAIGDETRPIVLFDVHNDVRQFISRELDDLFRGYWRNLMRSQPNHIELLVEKNTLTGILRPIAAEYCIPMTSGRGFSSFPPRAAMAERFRRSGKDKLVLIIVSDLDPDGEQIAQSFAAYMRDDFDIKIHPVKAAIRPEHATRFNIPTHLEAKKSSVNHAWFVRKYGNAAYEVEALKPEQLQQVVTETIDSLIDCDLFNAERELEKKDSAELEVRRKRVFSALGNLGVQQ